jgi:probable rRNA maturation factor
VTAAARLNLQLAIADAAAVPAPAEFSRWVNATLPAARAPALLPQCVTVRLVEAAESQRFNGCYRGIDQPTNVLAFPAGRSPVTLQPAEEQELGDLLICWPVVQAEATAQGKSCCAHLAHLTVHGTLHLLGYDHQNDADAAIMEGLEQRIMRDLEFANPYEADT